jgi:hypothetical protein
MTGDLADMVSRLLAVLPKRWFGEQSPNLSAILTSLATPWTWVYDLLGYTINQTRLATATDDWLELIAYDYCGNSLKRHTGEADVFYRIRIQNALMREAATRSAVSTGLESLIGSTPVIFEPAKTLDTGAYGTLAQGSSASANGLAYGQAGGWGSLSLPMQFFITVVRPPTPGVGMLAGYGIPIAGYGAGAISYVDLALLPGAVTDQEIQSTLCSLLPVNTVAWLQII